MSLLLSKAGTIGLEKAIKALDDLGGSMPILNMGGGFVSGVTIKGEKISILAFEVANTIAKGVNLMHSLSKENIKHLKEVVLPSEGVQLLISKDMEELLKMAAADKREEFEVFSREVVRFGNQCKDCQWHNLDRHFYKLGPTFTPQIKLEKEAEAVMMQQLITIVHHTAELYHELHSLDKLELDYRQKLEALDKFELDHQQKLLVLEEVTATAVLRGSLQNLRRELKRQRKHIRSLKKMSLWCKSFEEVTEKLVDMVHFLHMEIHGAFGNADGDKPVRRSGNSHQRLGPAGLALHYANIITLINSLVTEPSSVPTNTRDTLYQGLPPNIQSALLTKLQFFQIKEELNVRRIKSKMEKTLRWLVLMATNTTKAHHIFGCVGEWGNTRIGLNRKLAGQTDLMRIETLHHADKEKTDTFILDLVVWLHHIISYSIASNGKRGNRSPIRSPILSPSRKDSKASLPENKNCNRINASEIATQEN